jgi:hypothetical protein
VSFTEHVKKKGGDFAEAARAERDATVAPALAKQVADVPALRDRPRAYLSGGTAWALATLCHPDDRRPFTPVTAADIDALEKKLAADPTTLPAPAFANIADQAARDWARAEFEKVKKVYTPEQLLAGVEVLKAAAAEFGLDKPGKSVFFARHGYVGWLLAYVAEAELAPK